MAIAKAGSLLMVDHGSYSDYSVDAFFVVLRDFDPVESKDSFLAGQAADPKIDQDERWERDRFIAWLLAQGLLLEVEHGTLYLGDYSSSPEEFSFTPVIPEA